MHVQYDRTTKLLAVGPSPWAKLGPERWFDHYKIICADSKGYSADYVVNLNLTEKQIGFMGTQNVIDSELFQKLINSDFKGYKALVYRPVDAPDSISADRFIANPLRFSEYENKRFFREQFAGQITIPRFAVVPFEDLTSQGAKLFQKLQAQLGKTLVIQDEQSGGGRGTFIVGSDEAFMQCLEVLKGERKGEQCVISEFVEGIERSIQMFVSESHILKGPVQQQLIKNPHLLDPSGRGGMYFCGGRLIDSVSNKVSEQIQSMADRVAHLLRDTGYHGIFGLDFIVDKDEKVYAIEINARTTGLLPLLNENTAYQHLYLLHILELLNADYKVADDQAENQGPGSFVVLFNQTGSMVSLSEEITTGNYQVENEQLVKINGDARWQKGADCLIQLFGTKERPAKPNLKLCNIFLKGVGFNDQGDLTDEALKIVTILKQHIAS